MNQTRIYFYRVYNCVLTYVRFTISDFTKLILVALFAYFWLADEEINSTFIFHIPSSIDYYCSTKSSKLL